MRSFTKGIAKAAVLFALYGAGAGANAAIEIILSEPEFIDKDTFQLLVTLTEPYGVALGGLDVDIDFGQAPLFLHPVVKQSGVPGSLENLSPFTFGTISYGTAATVAAGPLFQLIFDVVQPVPPMVQMDVAKIDVIVEAFPEFVEEELPPITRAASQDVTLIPEPASYFLFGAGLMLVAWARRHRIAHS